MPERKTCYEIDPADEMYCFLRTLGRPEEQLFCEYMQTGFGSYFQIREILKRLGRDLSATETMLDFAAGYGRVVRFLLRDLEPHRVTIAEIDKDAVAFQVDRFGVEGIVSHADPDAVELPGPFDLITSISLFSHLPEDLFRRWLVRLTASLAPDGLFLFTTHGALPDEQGREADHQFAFESESRALDHSIYGSALVSRAFVEAVVREELPGRKVLAFLPQTLNNHQDVYVLGPDSESAIPFEDLTLPRAYLDGLHLEGGRVRLLGWGLSTFDGTPGDRVRAFDDDEIVFDGRTGVERPDVADMFGDSVRLAGFDGAFPWRDEMSRGVLTVEVADHRGLRCRIFHRIPF